MTTKPSKHMNALIKSLTDQDLADLKTAQALLETPSLTSKIANVIGQPLEAGIKRLPENFQDKLGRLVQTALNKAADAALWSLDHKTEVTKPSNFLHKTMAAASGAVGGVFGFTALAVELPVSTTIMLRSIADIARCEGFDLNEPETKQACLEVFALGGPSDSDDGVDSSYYAARVFMSEVAQLASQELAKNAAQNGLRGLTPAEAAIWLTKFIEYIAGRFGVVITEKMAAQALPILGAAAGATINTLFIDFYQDMAKGHFIVKRLEKVYGEAVVQKNYLGFSS
jgi:hypothetical protein